jgi:hypothetical protein
MKLKKLGVFVPMTLALAISQSLHAAPVEKTIEPSNALVKKTPKNTDMRYDSVGYQIKRNKNGERLLDMTNPKHYKLAKGRLSDVNYLGRSASINLAGFVPRFHCLFLTITVSFNLINFTMVY